MRNYEMVLMALKSGQTKTVSDLKAEIPGLEWWNMAKYVARMKYLAGAEVELMKAGKPLKAARARDAETLRLINVDKFKSWNPSSSRGCLSPRPVVRSSASLILRPRLRGPR